MKQIILTAILATVAISLSQTVKVDPQHGRVENLNRIRSGSKVTAQDKAFLMHAEQVNMLEVALGKIAQKNGKSMWSREYGMMMENDHSMGLKEIIMISQKTRVPLAQRLNQKNQLMVSKFRSINGDRFDRAYRQEMIKGHGDFLKVIEKEIQRGNNAPIRNFAITVSPVVRQHQKMAQRGLSKM